MRQHLLHTVTIFSSMSTLICCALPALLVTLGLGATMASLSTDIPGLVWISAHKPWVFLFAGTMLTISGLSQYLTRNQCPSDATLAQHCSRNKKIARWVWAFSTCIYLTGLFFAYGARYVFT